MKIRRRRVKQKYAKKTVEIPVKKNKALSLEPTPYSKFFKLISFVFVSFCSWIGLFGYFLPKLSIDAISDANSRTKTYFKITNIGNIKLNDVRYKILLNGFAFSPEVDDMGVRLILINPESSIEFNPENSLGNNQGPFDNTEESYLVESRDIGINEVDNIDLNSCIAYFAGTSDDVFDEMTTISVVVSYKPQFFPIQRTNTFNFKLDRSNPQMPVWKPIAKIKRFLNKYGEETHEKKDFPFRYKNIGGLFQDYKNLSKFSTKDSFVDLNKDGCKECLVEGKPTDYEFVTKTKQDYFISGKIGDSATYTKFLQSNTVRWGWIKAKTPVICQYGRITALFGFFHEPILQVFEISERDRKIREKNLLANIISKK